MRSESLLKIAENHFAQLSMENATPNTADGSGNAAAQRADETPASVPTTTVPSTQDDAPPSSYVPASDLATLDMNGIGKRRDPRESDVTAIKRTRGEAYIADRRKERHDLMLSLMTYVRNLKEDVDSGRVSVDLIDVARNETIVEVLDVLTDGLEKVRSDATWADIYNEAELVKVASIMKEHLNRKLRVHKIEAIN
jgi:hypothetical protein